MTAQDGDDAFILPPPAQVDQDSFVTIFEGTRAGDDEIIFVETVIETTSDE